jgi:hypothetical protein
MHRCVPFLIFAATVCTGCDRGGDKREAPAAQIPVQAPNAVANSPVKETAKTPPPVPVLYAPRELAKVLDLTALPSRDGTTFSKKFPVHISGTAPGTIPEVAEFYREAMLVLGWKTEPIPGVVATDEHASLKFVKDGHIALLFMGKGFREKNDPPKTSFNLVFHGNFDARTLPSRENPMIADSTPTMALYRTQNPIADEAEWAAKALVDAGWQEFFAFGSLSRQPDPKRELRAFRKRGYALNLYVSKYGPRNDTNVNYTVRTIPYEIPAPANAAQIEFDDEQIKLRCEIPGDLTSAGEFYLKAMPAAGFEPLPGEKQHPTYWNLRFAGEKGDVILVALANATGETTKVDLLRIPAAVVAALKKGAEQPPEKKPAVAEKELFAADIPLPKNAKNVKRVPEQSEITFSIAGEIAPVVAEVREQLTAAGWQEEKNLTVESKNAAFLNFRQPPASLRINFLNIGLGDGTQATIRTIGVSWRPKSQ